MLLHITVLFLCYVATLQKEIPPCQYELCLEVNSSASGEGSFSEALWKAHSHGQSVEIKLGLGKFNLSMNDLLTFSDWTKFALSGQGMTETMVTCDRGGIGLVFQNSSQITLRNLSILTCGRILNTTSIIETDSNTTFLQSKSAIYFNSCSNITLEGVQIQKSNGMGMTMYNTGGTNLFLSNEFINNRIQPNDSTLGGGGVVIETSHCAPGDHACTDDYSKLVTSDSSYIFEECQFISNVATSHYLPPPSEHPHAKTHMAMGKGGGLSVSFKGRAYRNKLIINNSCTFRTNKAEWGGALYLAFGDTSLNNSVFINSSYFMLNGLNNDDNVKVGGALRIEIISYPPDQLVGYGKYNSTVTGNSITIEKTIFSSNFATWGGAMSFVSTRDLPGQISPNGLLIKECRFIQNTACRLATAVDITPWKPDIIDSKESFLQPVFEDCTFNSNKIQFVNITSYPVGLGALYINNIPTVFKGDNLFVDNIDTALVVSGTYVSVLDSSMMNFTGNQGRRGGALAFIGQSWLIAHENTRFIFNGNLVGTYGLGGAIYSVHFGEHDLQYEQNCFFQYYRFNISPLKWNATFIFHNNSADNQLNSIYMTSSLPCMWNNQEAFCEDATWIFDKKEGRNCRNEITTGPSKINVTEIELRVVPGWSQALGIKTFNDYGALVPPVLTACPRKDSFENDDTISVDKSDNYISDDGIVLYGKENKTGSLLLMTLDPRVVASEITVIVQECPPGFVSVLCQNKLLSGMTCNCVCMDIAGISCNNETRIAVLDRFYCMTPVSKKNKTNLVIGKCPYRTHEYQVTLGNLTVSELEEKVCGPYNRTGFLCSKCQPGYGVAINSYDYKCVFCKGHVKYSWALYLLFELGPITIVCFVIVLFGVSVASPSLNAFVFFSQIVSVPYYYNPFSWVYGIDYVSDILLYPVITIYGVWNLDILQYLFPKFCLSEQLSTLHVFIFDYVKALYPMLLIGLCYICIKLYDRNYRITHLMWKPFRYCRRMVYGNYKPSTSIIDAFTTLLILSYCKFLYVSYPLVSLISIHKVSQDTILPLKYRYYFDPREVLHHSFANITIFILGIIVMVVFIGLPPIFLTLYPFRVIQWCIEKLNVRVQIALRTFADTFLGSFRDGTNGERDCRWFAGIYMIFRIVIFIVNVMTDNWMVQYFVLQIICTLGIFVFALVRPYKSEFYNNLDVSFFTLLAILNSLSSFNCQNGHDVQLVIFYVNYILFFLPILYLIVLMAYYITKRRNCFKLGYDSTMYVDEETSDSRSTLNNTKNSNHSEEELPDRLIHPNSYTSLNAVSGMVSSHSSKKAKLGASGGKGREVETEQSHLLRNGKGSSAKKWRWHTQP